jgi:hypothetical protein
MRKTFIVLSASALVLGFSTFAYAGNFNGNFSNNGNTKTVTVTNTHTITDSIVGSFNHSFNGNTLQGGIQTTNTKGDFNTVMQNNNN